jgi:NADH-quinone oxidoreductase subunit M
LVGILGLYLEGGRTFDILALAGQPIGADAQFWIFLALLLGFGIKLPMIPFHSWLPDAHSEAPTAGSVILAGVLLKIGTYGFVRFSLPMLPDATVTLMPYLLWLSVAGIVYGALVALAQKDIKRLIAYSSVSHLGFCMLGIFAVNRLGMQGGVLQMINHGLSTGGLFALVGMLYERYHTRQIADLGGLARKTPVLAFFMLVMTLSSIGLPGLNGFAGEFLLLLGMFQRAWVQGGVQYWAIAVLAVSGVVLGAWYMLYLVQRVFFGPLREPQHASDEPPIRDLSLREVMALAPLVAFIVWIGLQPRFFLDRMSGTLDRVTADVTRAERREGSPRLAADGTSAGRNARVAVPATAKRLKVDSGPAALFSGRQSRGPALSSGRRYGGPTALFSGRRHGGPTLSFSGRRHGGPTPKES